MLEFDRNQTRVHLALEMGSGNGARCGTSSEHTSTPTRPFQFSDEIPMNTGLLTRWRGARKKIENFDVHCGCRVHPGTVRVLLGARSAPKKIGIEGASGPVRPYEGCTELHALTRNPRELKSRKMLALFARAFSDTLHHHTARV